MCTGSGSVDNAPLFVVGLSVCRTGTTTLKSALEILYHKPCYHMTEVVCKHREHVKLWNELNGLIEQDPNNDLPEDVIRQIFRGYRSTTDIPSCTIYRQLMKLYPEAKFVFIHRDPYTWIQSMRQTALPKKFILGTSWLDRLKERIFLVPGIIHLAEKSLTLALGGNVDLTSDDQLIRGYRNRYDEIKRVIPAERLLVFHLKDGWDPLCRFLGKTIPDVPFPHMNDRAQMQNRLKKMNRRMNGILLLSAFLICLITAMGWALFVSGTPFV
ncbi:Sulfotransferase family [Fasciola gigantica]|uniref:Sulfotransferase family n=1 Tax=Fasciola gigantica TaxID=46835 RepID=A0A504YW90_FASGI|nr:Sulfotransferase family [Fasciola gigantica]